MIGRSIYFRSNNLTATNLVVLVDRLLIDLWMDSLDKVERGSMWKDS